MLQGGAGIAHTFMQLGLVDEYRLMIHPVVLGSGKRLFRDGSGLTALRLVDTRTFSTGIVLLTYQPARSE
jgi:dihydrofolate reductase